MIPTGSNKQMGQLQTCSFHPEKYLKPPPLCLCCKRLFSVLEWGRQDAEEGRKLHLWMIVGVVTRRLRGALPNAVCAAVKAIQVGDLGDVPKAVRRNSPKAVGQARLMYATNLEFCVPLFTENLVPYRNGTCTSKPELASGFQHGSRRRVKEPVSELWRKTVSR